MSRHIFIDPKRGTAEKLSEVASRMAEQFGSAPSQSLAAHAAILFAHERREEFEAFVKVRDGCKPTWGKVGGLKKCM